ncbi:MAG: hypothetical protein JWL77_6350 [Chthonomonadaceae bacterium]|nr:hypothetical protein [Chthonomonadaceae bacterium]
MPKSRIRIQRDAVLPRIEKKRDGSICVIAIEGERTEKQYFQKFGSTKIRVEILPTLTGDSAEPEGVIERLRKYKQDNDLDEDDKCWLVVDVDHRNAERLNNVCTQAKAERFQVAISNPCFEFWLFLHKFEADELSPSIHQVPLEKRPHETKQIVKYDYKSLSYKEFRDDVEMAVQRAKRKENSRRTAVPGFPGTDVYKVVESLPVKVLEN